MPSQLEQKIENLDQKQLSDLVKLLVSSSSDAKKQTELFIASFDPKKASSIINKLITSFKNWVKRADFYDSREASRRIEEITIPIERYLLRNAPDLAVIALQKIIEQDQNVFRRIDDSYGWVGSQYTECFKLLDAAFSLSTISPDQIAKYLVDTYINDEYGGRSYLFDHVKLALQGERAESLKKVIEEYAASNKLSSYQEEGMRLCYADLIKDVDLYIDIVRKFSDPPSLNDICDIARRLISHFRSEEAITWLTEYDVKVNEGHLRSRKINLLEEAYCLEGDTENAKKLLWDYFTQTQSADYFKRYCKYCDESDKIKAKEDALNLAKNTDCLNTAIVFLDDIDELALLGQLIISRHEELDSHYYSLYRAVSKRVGVEMPLAGVLLRRAIILDILDHAKSKIYSHAVSDLKICNKFSEQVADWGIFEDQVQFLSRLKSLHSKKKKFWLLYEE